MGYSPGFLVKIGRFRLNPNSPDIFTNNPVRSQKSICKHLGDVFREFGLISSTCQNQPFSKPQAFWAFWSKSADFGSLLILSKTSRTIRYVVRNTFASIFATFVGSWGRFPALAKISHVQNHGLQPRFLVKIGRFRLIENCSENFTNKFLRTYKSICKPVGDVFRAFWPISSTYQNPPSSKPWAIAQAFWSKSADFGSFQILSKTSRTSLYAVRNPFPSILATFLGSLGRFPALAKISHVQNHGLQPRLFGQNRPISAHCKFSGKLHEQVFTHIEIHLQACWRRFQGVWADFQHLPKSATFKTMGYSPGFFVKIGRFRLSENSPENFTNTSLRTQTSICTHVSDVFREFWPISSTYQNPPSSNPWAIAQDFGQNRPIAAHSKFSRKLHEQVFTQLEIHFQACWRRFYRVWGDFQHLPKSPMFKTMGYSSGFLVKIGRFRLIANSPENITNKSLRTQTYICKHVGDVFREFGPISSTCQNHPCSKPWAIAQAFSSKSADFVYLKILPKTSRTSLYALRDAFASMLATFSESLGRFPALAKISHVQNHGLQPRLFGQNRPISAHCKFSGKLHEQVFTHIEIHLQACWRRFQGVWADFQHLPKSATFKTMGYSPGFLVKIGRFRLSENSPENFTNTSLRTQTSICTHVSDVFREFWPISSTYQNPPSSKQWAIAQDFGQNRPIAAHSKFSRKLHEQVFTQLEIHFQACWRRFYRVWADFQHLPKSPMFKTMGYSPGFFVKIGRFRLIQNYPENFTNNPLRSQKSICKHLGDVFREFGPIFSTCQNQPFSKPSAIAQAFWSKSADFGSFQILSKTSRTTLYAVRNPFPSIQATFLGSLGRFPALAKISHVQNHGLQPRLFGQNRPISAHCKLSGKLHEQVFMHIEIHLKACWQRFQGVWADFQHLPKSATFKTMGYSPGFLVKIGRFRLSENSPENFTNKSLRTQTSICTHVSDVFREFWPISSTCQNPPSSKPWAIAQAFWSKSADFGSIQILPTSSRTIPYVVRNPFASILATFLGSLG